MVTCYSVATPPNTYESEGCDRLDVLQTELCRIERKTLYNKTQVVLHHRRLRWRVRTWAVTTRQKDNEESSIKPYLPEGSGCGDSQHHHRTLDHSRAISNGYRQEWRGLVVLHQNNDRRCKWLKTLIDRTHPGRNHCPKPSSYLLCRRNRTNPRPPRLRGRSPHFRKKKDVCIYMCILIRWFSIRKTPRVTVTNAVLNNTPEDV